MELNNIKVKIGEFHRKPSVQNFEVIALSPFIYIGTIGYFAGSVAVESVKPVVKRIKSKIDEIDNSDLHKTNRRVRSTFDPDPRGVQDNPTYPPGHTDHMLTVAESGIPLGLEQQGDIQ